MTRVVLALSIVLGVTVLIGGVYGLPSAPNQLVIRNSNDCDNKPSPCVTGAGHTPMTCVAVGPSSAGSANGTSWTNRRAALPTTAARGTRYYMMDGSYSSYTLTTANSGTTRIEIIKAQSYDYGRTADGCTNDISAGWNAATMGSSQATITSFQADLGIDYVTMDGNGQYSGPGCGDAPGSSSNASDCGIFLGPLTSSGGSFFFAGSWNNGATRNSNWILRYIEGQGGGDAANANFDEDIVFRDGTNNTLIDHVWLHDSGCEFFKVPWVDGFTLSNSYIHKNYSAAACHGQMWEGEVTSNNMDFHGNVISDIGSGSTGVWAIWGGNHNNWVVYDNVFIRPNGSTRGGLSNGMVACIHAELGTHCQNWKIIGNTFINVDPYIFIYNESVDGTYWFQNNLAYNSNVGFDTAVFANGIQGAATLTQDHNSYLNSGSPGGGTGTITVTSGAANPFVDWINYNYHLVSNATNWNNGGTQSSPYTVDRDGNARPGGDGIWNTGAYEFQ